MHSGPPKYCYTHSPNMYGKLSFIFHPVALNIPSQRSVKVTNPYSAYQHNTSYLHNWLPAEVLGTVPCKPIIFKKRVRKVIIGVN
jgi:hypothetical protein